MSFREKSAWISLLSVSVIYGAYFWPIVQRGPHTGAFPVGRLIATVIALIVVQVVLHIAVAIAAPKEAQAPRDEREKLIDLKAIRIAYAGLATGIALICLVGGLDPPVFSANALLFALVTSELLRSSCQIVQYRRSA